jgi:hypothetical protein
MRLFLLIALLALAACAEASGSRVDERTFRIEGPAMASASDASIRRLANRYCPKGYYVLDQASHRGGPDRAAYMPGDDPVSVWTIRCI